MEPSGRNQWQPVANRKTQETANQAKTVATGCDQLAWDLDGKEGVSGSSPEEGSRKSTAKRPVFAVFLVEIANGWHVRGTRGSSVRSHGVRVWCPTLAWPSAVRPSLDPLFRTEDVTGFQLPADGARGQGPGAGLAQAWRINSVATRAQSRSVRRVPRRVLAACASGAWRRAHSPSRAAPRAGGRRTS